MEVKLSERRSIIIEGNTACIVDYFASPARLGIKHQFDVEQIDVEIEVIAIYPHRALIKYGNKIIKVVIEGKSISYEMVKVVIDRENSRYE